VWDIFKAIEDKSSKEWNSVQGDEGARTRIRQLAREQRYEETLKVIRHWQSIKQAKHQGSHSSASAEVDTIAQFSRPPRRNKHRSRLPQYPPLTHPRAALRTTWMKVT
jgi:hypothetical protein